ncbi:MAG: M23 family metallopeptidase [Capnocytophaga sp.]|nr:M23 family metallopeptidase [Capnocytophaga sp.]
MRNKTTHICLGFFVFFCNAVTAQFNMLNPQPKEEKSPYEVVEPQPEEPEKKSKKRRWKLFSSEKSELRKEVDSLKQIIRQKDSEKTVFKRLEDSILISVARKIIAENYPEKKTDRGKKQKTKTAMPINGDLQITSPFGMRFHPILKRDEMHNGIDIKAHYEFVYSVLGGKVSSTGWDTNGGGIFIKIVHPNGFETSYSHLSEVYYKNGEQVEAGFIIGRSGNTGSSTAPHLHFTVKENDGHIDPIPFLNDLININNNINE